MKHSRGKLLSIFLFLSLLVNTLATCKSPSPTDSPLSPLPTDAPPTRPAAATPKPALPPTPTRDPRPPTDPAPILLERQPARGQEAALDQTIRLRFDQAMDRVSVQTAFKVSTAGGDAPEIVPGRVVWLDAATLRFTPDRPLARNAQYRVTVGDAARSQRGRALQREVAFSFHTVGYLEVSQVIPAPETAGVTPDARITVMFNRPVVPLTTVSDLARDGLPRPLTLTEAGDGAPVTGSGEWLNTSIYVFYPDRPLRPGHLYQGRVAAGLADTTGGVLAEDYEWTFGVALPAIVSTNPYNAASQVKPTGVISVTFSQPMDRASTEAAFQVQFGRGPQEGRPLKGTFNWNGAGTQVGFKPDEPLMMDTPFRATVSTAARAKPQEGGAPDPVASLRSDYAWTFETAPYPRIIRTEPADGVTAASPGFGLKLYFSAPVEPQTVLPRVTIVPTPTQVYTSWHHYDRRFGIQFNAIASTAYTVTVAPGIRDPYGNTIDEETVIRYTTHLLDPLLQLNTTGVIGTYNGHASTELFAVHRGVSRLSVALYQMPLRDFLEIAGVTSDDAYRAWRDYAPDPANRVRRWVRKTEAGTTSSITRLKLAGVGGGPLPPGIYYLEVSAPETSERDYDPERHVLLVSKTHLMLKLAEREALVWATDLQSGQPVAGLPIRLGDASATTDADGVARFAFSTPLAVWDAHYTVVQHSGLPYDDAFAIALSQWDSGISPWNFDLYSSYRSVPYHVYFYTDRPIYRPGQPVYFKGIVRLDDDARYDLPYDLRELHVRVHDGQGKLVYQETLPLSDMGTLDGQFILDEQAALGYYYLSTSIPGHDHWGYPRDFDYGVRFRVAEYRKPEYEVTVTADRPQYLHGDTITVAVQADYYFGGPVANADVRWTLQTSDYFFHATGLGRFRWDDSDAYRSYSYYYRYYDQGYSRPIADGHGTTDAQGRLVFTIPADIAAQTNSQRFTIGATITDLTDQTVSGRTDVVVHRGEFYAGLRPQRYVGAVGEALALDVRTVGWDGAAWPEQDLTVVFDRRTWYSVREADGAGHFYWTWTYTDTTVYTGTLTTDDEGEALASFLPIEGGVYIVRVLGQDTQGNRVRSATRVWVSSRDYVSWPMENNDRIELIVDQESYQPGETVTVLIPSPFQGQIQALLTVERGRVLESRVITLTSNSEAITLPVTAEMAPNAYVSVFMVKGVDENQPSPAFRLGYAAFQVSAERRALTLALTPDKDVAAGERYAPGERVAYRIRVTDYAGNPAAGTEVSLNLTDLSVLALAAPNAPPLMDFFYGERGLGVRTATGLTLSMDRLNEKIIEEIKGGGGGVPADVEIRRDFPDTAYWAPAVYTDADGRATVQVALPDSLTTWRLVGKAVTADTLVGEGHVDVVSTKDLLIRPVTPRFFVVGDRAELGAVVHNNTDVDLSVKVALNAGGLTLESDALQTVAIPAGGQARVEWTVSVPGAPGFEQFADLTFSASGGGHSDATKPTLGIPPDQLIPIYKYVAPEVVGTTGDLAGEAGETALEAVVLPPDADITQGELKIQIDPSLTAGMNEGFKYLKHYPYECTEQTVSRFLPNVLTFRALKATGQVDASLESNLRQQVAVGLQRLYNHQHVDGGWGWWIRDQSNLTVSAWVVFGLVKAQQAGFVVDQGVVDRGVAFLNTQLLSPKQLEMGWQANRQAFILYVLAEAGVPDVARTATLFENRAKLSHYAKAYLALALHLVNPDERSQIDTLLSDLADATTFSASGAYWKEEYTDWWNWNTGTRSTAIILDALVHVDPENDLASNAVRWLMGARSGGRWETTQETAWSLIALTDWVIATGELEGNYDWRVELNSELLGEGVVTPENIEGETTLHAAFADLLLDEVNRLLIEKGPGPGRLYYTTHLRTFLPVEEAKALNRGMFVAREYTLASCEDASERVSESANGRGEGCPAVDGARVGEVVRVKVTLVAPNDLHYVVVEDPFPAGAEAVDASLKTATQVGQAPDLRRVGERHGWGWWWFSHTELHDEKAVLFATYLPAGTYEYTYLIRPSLPGEFRVLPTTAYQMYFPEVFGQGEGVVFRIGE